LTGGASSIGFSVKVALSYKVLRKSTLPIMSEKHAKMEKSSEGKPPTAGATRKPPRQMAAKACERCRRRKIKCDEFFPCGQCTRMRVQCKIEDPAEKRREQQQT
jgi:hypothetical protein